MKTKPRKAKLQAGIRSISVTSNEAEQKLEILRPDAAGIDWEPKSTMSQCRWIE